MDATPDAFPVLSSKTGVIEAPVERVTDAMASLYGDAQPPLPNVEIDRARRRFATQGDWWFRGEVTLVPHDAGGTLVTYRVLNVATKRRWMVPIVLWQYRRSKQLVGMYDIEPLLRALRKRTGVAAST